jgi:hypothetical protein
MDLSDSQKQRLRWAARLSLVSWAILAVLTPPLLVCVTIFNQVSPYNRGPAPLWVYGLLYGWAYGALGALSVSALLSLIRCPACGRFLFLSREPRVKTPVPAAFALFHAYRYHRIHCYRCGHEYALA